MLDMNLKRQRVCFKKCCRNIWKVALWGERDTDPSPRAWENSLHWLEIEGNAAIKKECSRKALWMATNRNPLKIAQKKNGQLILRI